MTKFTSIRIIFLPTILCLISGCSMGNNSSTQGQPTPTPTPSPSAHSVAISWDASPSTDLQGYKVYRGQTSGGPYTDISAILATSTMQFTDSAVLSGQTYFYVVTSIDINGLESAPSPEQTAQIPSP